MTTFQKNSNTNPLREDDLDSVVGGIEENVGDDLYYTCKTCNVSKIPQNQVSFHEGHEIVREG